MNKQTIAQFLEIKKFPYEIYDNDGGGNGRLIYTETATGVWDKYIRDEKGRVVRYEDSNGFWKIQEFNEHGERVYIETSNGFWKIEEFNEHGERVYIETSKGYILDRRTIELSLEDIAAKFNIPVTLLKIKK